MVVSEKFSIMALLVAVAFTATMCWPTPAPAYTVNPKHVNFQTAQQTARANLERAAQTGGLQAQQVQPAPAAGAYATQCYYPCVPYTNVPSYGWNVPATAGGGTAGAQPPAPQAPTSWYSTGAPCWTPQQYGWGVPATAGAAPALQVPPANTGGYAAQTCYQVWWPQCWGGPFSVCWGN